MEKELKKVVVLLSSYNGEEYIREQIDSILNQIDVDIKLFIRDDGSNDKTTQIIEEYDSNKILLVKGENIGYIDSFNYLIKNAPVAEYYAYADQDDVWMPEKIISAIKNLNNDFPMLYAGNALVTDEHLNIKNVFSKREKNYFDSECKILNSGAQGCTLVFNKLLRDKIADFTPGNIWPHDYWITTVCLFIGKVVYDPKPYMFYRQHLSNVTGGDLGIKNKVRKQIDAIKRSNTCPWSRMSKDILDGYQNLLEKEDEEMLVALTKYKQNISQKFKLLFNLNFRKESFIKSFVLRILIIINRV